MKRFLSISFQISKRTASCDYSSLMPIHYCQCCKINHEQGRRHIFSRQHVKKLQEWSERQQKRVNDCLLLAKNGYANPTITSHSFWCAFCACEVLDEAPMFLYFANFDSISFIDTTASIIYVQKIISIKCMRFSVKMVQTTS